MRVVAGKYRSRTLLCQEGLETRPTSDRVREALFSILSSEIIHAKVLDLCAGTGALSIESLSRGAASATAVEKSQSALKVLNKNKDSLAIDDALQIYCADVCAYLLSCKEKYDVIFFDPPYRSGLYNEVLQILAQKDILESGKLIVIEHDQTWSFSAHEIYPFEVYKVKKYGKTYITILRRQ